MNKNDCLIFRIFGIDSNYVQMLPSHVQIHPHIGEDLGKFEFFFYPDPCYASAKNVKKTYGYPSIPN